ncbi:MAG: hypothetical protein U1E87_03075 [Alphaproteobacteria bacterium]
MRGLVIATAAALSLVLGAGLQAEEQTTGNTQPSGQENPDRVICKRVEVIGSRIPKRECHTAREWEQIRQDAQDTMREGQTHQHNTPG